MTRISSARVIPISHPMLCVVTSYRVWVEWWGLRQAYERDFGAEAEAQESLALITATDPTPDELWHCGWRSGGVASHGGAHAPPP